MQPGATADCSARPLLAATYDASDPALLDRILEIADCVEVTPDTIARRDGRGARVPTQALNQLAEIASAGRLLVHGVGLSIGSHDGMSEQYLALLDDLLDHADATWHSEHLGYTTVNGEYLGTMLSLPRTAPVLEMICERVDAIQDRYPIPFLVENIASVLPDPPGEYSEAQFLNALTDSTGCGLLLDVHNLECDAHNFGFDIERFLCDLNVERVEEVHLAGGVEYEGVLLDVHSRTTRDSTLALAREVLKRARGTVRVVTYEILPEAIATFGQEAFLEELRRLKRELCS